MDVKERRRERKNTKSAEEERPRKTEGETIEKEEKTGDQSSTIMALTERTTQATQRQLEILPTETVVEEIDEEILLPDWGDITQSEWMYSIPDREKDKPMWAEEWSDFLLEWTKKKHIHVISVSLFLSEPPFKDIAGKVDSFRCIGEVLVKKEIAEWLDKNRRQLRVYWRFLEEWADSVYRWALESGTVRLDVKSIVIQEEAQAFSNLPERDLHIIMTLLVEKQLAEWIDKKKGAIKILL
ncbi:MAG: hypothetical protein EAX81_05635 [Candidatus Thorarchaeota archaeon]|nr:hypothetical protein [Candidatus Thorarchaeota archaeon]